MESTDNTVALDSVCIEESCSVPEYLQHILDSFHSFKECNSSCKRVNVFSLLQLRVMSSQVEEAQTKFRELLEFLIDTPQFTVFVGEPNDDSSIFVEKILGPIQEKDAFLKCCVAMILRLLSRTVISVDPDPLAGLGVNVDTVALTWSLVHDGHEDYEYHALGALLNFISVSKLFAAILERACNFLTKIGEIARTASSAFSQQLCFSILTAVKDHEAFKLLVCSSPNGDELVAYAISLAKDTISESGCSAFKFLHACIENTAVRKLFLAIDHAILPVIVLQLSSPDLLSQKRAIHCMWMMCTSMVELKDIFVTNYDALNIVIARNLHVSSDANMRNSAFGFLSVLCGNDTCRQMIAQNESLVASVMDLIFTEMNAMVQSKVINVVLTLATASSTVAQEITQREDTFLGSFIALDTFSNLHPTYVPRFRFVSSMVSKNFLSREKFLVVSLQLADRIVQTVATESDSSILKSALTLCGSLNEFREVQRHLVADPSQPFLNRLNHFVLTHPDLKADALNAASQLVFRSDDAQKAVFHHALFDTALSVIQGDAGDARTKALALVYSIANNVDLKANLFQRGIVAVIAPFLRQLLQSPTATMDRNYATGILNVMTSKCTANQIAFGDLDSGIVPLLIDVIRTDTSKARNFALSAFVSLAKAPENVWIFRDTSLGLLHAALDVARKESGDIAMYALSVIDEIVKSAESHSLATQDRLDLNTILFRFVEDTAISTIQAKSLRILLHLTQSDGFQFTYMAKTCVPEALSGQEQENTGNALKLLQEYLMRMKTKLLPSSSAVDHQLLMSNIHTLSCSSRIAAVSHAIMNPDLGLVPALFQLTESSSPHDIDLRASFSGFVWNIVENGDDTTAQQLMPLRILQHGLRQIDAELSSSPSMVTAGAMATTISVSKPLDRIASNYLNLTMNLARHYEVREAIKAAGTVHVMKKLMARSQGVDTVRAMIVLLFLFGNEEATAGTSMSYVDGEDVAVTKERVHKLMSIFDTTLQSQRGEDYFLGTFCLPLILQACLVVAQSDSKKAWLLELGCIPLLTKTLVLYVNNQRSIPNCGGGGRDHESAALAIETLVHLSFHFDRSQDDLFRTTFLQQNMHLLELLPDIAHKEKLIADAKQKAHRLYQRLTFTLPLDDLSAAVVTRTTIDPITSSSSAMAALTTTAATATTALHSQGDDAEVIRSSNAVASRQHVMISYCWNPSAQPALVHQLGQELKRLGYDVWRDEEGSSLVPAMSGLIDDVMAEAIQCSHTIIICVSAAYKLSSNCRMEATYASTLARRHQVKLVYVMMNEHYTTVSTPEHCDGWLGFMIGNAYWHAMWDTSYVAGVAAAIAKTLPSQTMLVRPSSTVLSSMSTSLSTTADSVSIPSIESVTETPTPPVVPPNGPSTSRIAEERLATNVGTLPPDAHDEPVAGASGTPPVAAVHSPIHTMRESHELHTPVTPTASPARPATEHITPTPTCHTALSSQTTTTTAVRPDVSSDPFWMMTGQGSDSALPPALTTPLSLLRRTSSMSLSSSLSYLLPDDVVEQAWLLLQTPSLIIDEQQLLQHLLAEGILSPPLLASCDAEDIDRIAPFLKKVPRRRFLLLMQHIRSLQPTSDTHSKGDGSAELVTSSPPSSTAAVAPVLQQSLLIWVFLAVVVVLFILLIIAYAIIYVAVTTRVTGSR